MKNNFYYFLSIFGFVLGIFICSFVNLGITFSIFLLFISIILFFFNKFLVHDFSSKEKIFLIFIFLISLSLGILRYEIKDNVVLDGNLEKVVGNKVILTGVVLDEPKVTQKQAVLTVDFKNIFYSSSSIAVDGRGLVSTDLYPEVKYGDLIKIYGKLEKPENFTDTPSQIKSQSDGARFDYISYLGKDNIFYKIDFVKTETISSGHGNIIKSFLFKLKNSFVKNIDQTINAPESSLMSGILLGAKNSIDQKIQDDFRKAGLSHVVALSGYNITIVADGIMKTLGFLPRNVGFSFGVLGIILFVLMSGASSTAVRASVMALIVILAQVTHRNYQAGRALIVAGVIMILFNPKILVFDISFQLSFLATVAIIYVAPILKNKFTFITERFALRDTISSSIAAQILVLPLILYKMGLLSLVALPANILVLAFVPVTMFFGFVTGMIGFIWLPLSLPFAWVSWFLLAYIIKLSGFFAGLPFASLEISWFSSGIMIVSYIFITSWIIFEHKRVV